MNSPERITTLLLDSSFLPYSFLTAKATFLHLIKNNIKSFDAEGNIIDSNLEWFSNNIRLYEDQPYLRSKDKTWFIPTVAVIKARFFYNRKKLPKTLSVSKLCHIFNFTCQICYEKFDKQDLTIEHIFPKSKGGTKSIENISLTCHSCQQKKKDLYPFFDKFGKNIKSIPTPLPVIPKTSVAIRKEWEKFFIYKTI